MVKSYWHCGLSSYHQQFTDSSLVSSLFVSFDALFVEFVKFRFLTNFYSEVFESKYAWSDSYKSFEHIITLYQFTNYANGQMVNEYIQLTNMM